MSHAYETAEGKLPVLDDFSLIVNTGGFTSVVGPSGCGKSTLTRLIAGLIKPNQGEIYLNGEKVTSPRPTVGMAFQNPVMLEWRSVLKNVTLPLEIIKPKPSWADQQKRARELLKMVSLEDFEDKRPSELSGGMRQRVSLCRALVHYPEVLVLDEPFGALDAFTREELWVVMNDLRKELEFTCLLITHDLRESVFLSDEVVVLSDRPAKTQHTEVIPFGKERQLDQLYSPEATQLLSGLRKQIEVAQGKDKVH